MKWKFRAAYLVGVGVLVLLASGCPAGKQPSKLETALANMAKDVVIPLEAQNLKNPLPATDEVAHEGEILYTMSCAICHGSDGHAETNLGRMMYPPAMDLTSPHVQHWSDAELFWIIQNGVRLTGMPAWKSTVSPTDTWKMVRFIRALPRLSASLKAAQAAKEAAAKSEAQLVAYGRTLYRQEGCFMCHQLDGEGGKVGPDLTLEGTRGRTKEWLVGHFKDPPAFTAGSIMPPYKNLTEEQLQALTAFLEIQKGSKP